MLTLGRRDWTWKHERRKTPLHHLGPPKVRILSLRQLNCVQANSQPAQPNPPQPTEHERCDGRVGYHGLGRTPKDRYTTGENSTLPNAFFNDCDARVRYQRETPAKRRIIELAIQGFNNCEIARLCDVTSVTVSQTLKQPWAREYMITTMRKESESNIQELLKEELLPSLAVVLHVRDNDQCRPELRMQAANSIIDRVLGKAAQPILSGKIEPEKLSDEELHAIASNGRGTTTDPATSSRAGTTQAQGN